MRTGFLTDVNVSLGVEDFEAAARFSSNRRFFVDAERRKSAESREEDAVGLTVDHRDFRHDASDAATQLVAASE